MRRNLKPDFVVLATFNPIENLNFNKKKINSLISILRIFLYLNEDILSWSFNLLIIVGTISDRKINLKIVRLIEL